MQDYLLFKESGLLDYVDLSDKPNAIILFRGHVATPILSTLLQSSELYASVLKRNLYSAVSPISSKSQEIDQKTTTLKVGEKSENKNHGFGRFNVHKAAISSP